MSRNFGGYKSGHAVSDTYFKNQPIWFDSDMLQAFIIGIISGALFTTLLMLL